MREVDILKQCLQISREAYEQELERQKAIGVKADYLMKFYTLLIAILNLSLPLIIQYTQIQNLRHGDIFIYWQWEVCFWGLFSL